MMQLYGERISLSSLECSGKTEQKNRAAFVEEILRQELTTAGEFESYYGVKCTPETLAMIDLNKPLFFDIQLEDIIVEHARGEIHYGDSVGYIGLSDQGKGVFNLELYIYPKFRRKGYAAEAVEVLLGAAFHGELQRDEAAERTVTVKKVIVSVRAENETVTALIGKMGFLVNESGAYIPVVFSEYKLDQPLQMRDYYITGERFDQVAAKQKYVYAVMHAYYSDWKLYGYFSTEKEARQYCRMHSDMDLHIEKLRCMDHCQSFVSLEEVQVLYRCTVAFRHTEEGWDMLHRLHKEDMQVISGEQAEGHFLLLASSNIIRVCVEQSVCDWKVAEKTAQDLLYQYLEGCDNQPSEETVEQFNEMLAKRHSENAQTPEEDLTCKK